METELNNNSTNIKSIIISTDDKKKEIKVKKERKDRVITSDKKWTICDNDYNPELQLSIMNEADISNIVLDYPIVK